MFGSHKLDNCKTMTDTFHASIVKFWLPACLLVSNAVLSGNWNISCNFYVLEDIIHACDSANIHFAHAAGCLRLSALCLQEADPISAGLMQLLQQEKNKARFSVLILFS